ncbi:hypothetical protein Q5P01_004652 [Channa striata]|uniref:Uncharacterized protein n=1 Tax=Channa striata TaxID=64152 RepID=A0AA88NC75_CHASR|nr:hypothetical protein Q5P01_004652 [Channa striata]
MAEDWAGSYESFPNMDQQETANWCRFAVRVAGNTTGAHFELIQMMKGIQHAQVDEDEQHDYVLLFCPAATRVQTDITNALSTLKSDKPVILVVMHHTYNEDYILAESRRQVSDPHVCLAVDVLFHEGQLLHCTRNTEARGKIRTFLNKAQVSRWEKLKNCASWWIDHPTGRMLLGGLVCVVVLVGIGVIAGSMLRQQQH